MFWIVTQLDHETWSNNRHVKDNICRKYFEWFGGLGLSSVYFLNNQPAPVTQLPVQVYIHSFEKVNLND